MAEYELDARRLLCPMPVIKTQNKMKALAPGDTLKITCTDPGALEDIPAWSRINGHTVLDAHQLHSEVILVLKKNYSN